MGKLSKMIMAHQVERMGRNFDSYPGFQPKTTPAQRYATQCMYLILNSR